MNLNSDLLLGIVYIPPEYSRYSSPDAFSSKRVFSSNVINSSSSAVLALKSPIRQIFKKKVYFVDPKCKYGARKVLSVLICGAFIFSSHPDEVF
jgi:hypothetical protein